MFKDDNQSLFSNIFYLWEATSQTKTPESCEPSNITEQPDMTTVYQKFVNNLLKQIYKITDKKEIETTAQQMGDCNNLVK